MFIPFNSDGIFSYLSTTHRNGDLVFPCVDRNKTKFTVSPSGKNTDNQPILIQDFIQKLANGDYAKIGSIRMNQQGSGLGNLRAIRDLKKSEALIFELERIRSADICKMS